MAAGVDGDTDGGCQLAGDTSFLLFCQTQCFEPYILIFHTFNSAKVKPRPARTRRLYLMVGHRTMGLNLSIGFGATAADFARRALRRLNLRPGCTSCQNLFPILWPFSAHLPGRSELGLVAANPFGNLPFKLAF